MSQGDGIELKEGSSGNIIRDNVIHDTNYPCILTHATNGAPNVIERNAMWSCGDHGIHSAADAVIRNNIFLSAHPDGIAMQPHQSGSPSELVVTHNTLLNAGGDAMSLRGISGPVVIANNALYAQGRRAFYANATNGLVFQGNVGIGGGSMPLDEGDLSSDFVAASFAGAPPMDLFPESGGALRGSGVTTHVASEDFNGTQRNGTADVSAYAHSGSGNPGWTLSAGFKSSTPSDSPGTGGAGGSPSEPGGSAGSSGADGEAPGSGASAAGPPSSGGSSGCSVGRLEGIRAHFPSIALLCLFARRRFSTRT